MQHPVLVKEMARWNAVFYASAILPAYEFFGVGEPPKELEDWKGKRVRALGGMGDAMRTLGAVPTTRSEEHTSELQSLMRNSYAVFCFTKKTTSRQHSKNTH